MNGPPTEHFDFRLPPELIAQQPAEPRDAARLFHLKRATGERRHVHVRDLPHILRPDDLLVVNDSRVIPARVFLRKPTGGRVEVLFLEPESPRKWRAMLQPSRRISPGVLLSTSDRAVSLEVVSISGGRALLAFPPHCEPTAFLEKYGTAPLPPYIRRAYPDDCRLAHDQLRYQTVFAKVPGSVAAPTAGLHFTPHLLGRLRRRGVQIVPVTLHVGPGTFRPVRAARIEEHRMESERYTVSDRTAAAVNSALEAGRRVVCVGTTVVRALESAAGSAGRIRAGRASTALFIYPPYRFRVAGALLTNFHLPRSTLLMLVCAFAGTDLILDCYREAVQKQYRFYSYGDCMFIE
ncbi:MAG TPA: tRNA preQ1(34) S-adenosylmethionine ribosyltransferase-isomerase QueA [Kiritimatiellae bacterium]|nr:tRNA preQ1(34) S-adenosylmethionine ribosyltransferase-isomerase QueA [Kiritimatiellia bacterium]